MKTIYVIAVIFISLLFFAIIAGVAYLPFTGKEVDYTSVAATCFITYLLTSWVVIPLTNWFKKHSPFNKEKEDK